MDVVEVEALGLGVGVGDADQLQEACAVRVVVQAEAEAVDVDRGRVGRGDDVALAVQVQLGAVEVLLLQPVVRALGVGGAEPSGTGLRGLADRVETLGGSLTVVSPSRGGTRLAAELPLGGESV